MDEQPSIPAYRLKTICRVMDGGNPRKLADKKEREKRIENYSQRVKSGNCIFTDEPLPEDNC